VEGPFFGAYQQHYQIMEGLRKLMQGHERVKNYVHTAFRYPLPPVGRQFMGFVYFLVPVVSGWYIMQWAIRQSHASIGERGEHLPVRQELPAGGIGGKHRVNADGSLTPIGGSGGWGAGVNLAVSDPETQERNRRKLLKFLKQQRQSTMGSAVAASNDDDAPDVVNVRDQTKEK
jgi:hypothetical protein